MSTKQISDKARMVSTFQVSDPKSLEKAFKNQSGKVNLADGVDATIAAMHLVAWNEVGNELSDLPTDPEKLKSARNSFAGGLKKDRNRTFLVSSLLKIGNQEMSGVAWAESLKLKIDDAAEKIRSKKIGSGNSVVRSGIELPLPSDIESNGQRGRQACDPLAEMANYLKSAK